ncbi:MAG: ISL3 family transposase [Thermoplasmata archaeon]|nr:ISL3 family transposase [Thermoplasmata archaeon]
MIGESVDNPVAPSDVLPADIAILHLLRLDPDRWQVDGISVDQGQLGTFPDSDPDAPVLEFSSDTVRSIDLGWAVIHVSMRHGLRHECGKCGGPMQVNKWVKNTYSSSPLCLSETFVSVSVPQLHCPECGGYPKARCPLVVRDHTYTRLLKLGVMQTLSQETVKATSEAHRVGPWIVGDILAGSIEEGKGRQDLSGVDTLYIDEIQFGHGQDYVTMVADQDHRMICGVKGNDMKSVEDVADYLESKDFDTSRIKWVCSDMSVPYKAGIRKRFGKAKQILDKFHLTKLVNTALDYARKRTNRELKKMGLEFPKKVKYTVLFRAENQDERHRARMEQIRMLNPELAQAFDLKEEFAGFFECGDKHEARSFFMRWYNRVRGSGIPELMDASRRLLKRLNEMLRWFDHRISNGVAEGMNNTYKKIKSAAYGFRNAGNFIDLCLYRKGRLDLSL